MKTDPVLQKVTRFDQDCEQISVKHEHVLVLSSVTASSLFSSAAAAGPEFVPVFLPSLPSSVVLQQSLNAFGFPGAHFK